MNDNEQLIENLIQAAIEEGKYQQKYNQNLPNIERLANIGKIKMEILGRMKPEAEIIPCVTGEQFEITQQPPTDPTTNPNLVNPCKNPFAKSENPTQEGLTVDGED